MMIGATEAAVIGGMILSASGALLGVFVTATAPTFDKMQSRQVFPLLVTSIGLAITLAGCGLMFATHYLEGKAR